MKIGMIGLGRMGGNMVRRLIKGGHQCVVFDLNQKNVQELCDVTHLDMQAVLQGLRTLLHERHIELLDANGRLVNGSVLLNDL